MRFFLTTAIDFVNSRPHLGTAYEKVTADVIARYKRLCGFDVHFLMGNDEHSQNVYKRAVEEGFHNDPVAYCDQMEKEFRAVWDELDCSYDDFIRTTEPRHAVAVRKMAQACYDAGDIYEGFYEGWYCVSCEAFKQEKDLVDGKCPNHPTLTPEWIKEKNYFFRLSKYRDALLKLFAERPEFLEPDVRRNEILRLLDAGLEDISVSRAGQSWGIPLPFAPENVAYVWFDALINYITAVGYGHDDERFAAWWPVDVHIIGKDITRFHTVVWPAMLMSAGVAVPRQVFGHGWVHYGGQRMSKSLGTSIDPSVAARKFGADPLRLYLVKEIAYGGDGDFTWERYQERYNVDLANNLGNLVSRLATMAEKYRESRLAPSGAPGRLAQVAEAALARYAASMDRFALHDGAAAAFTIVDAANEFIAETAPWQLAKDPANGQRLSSALFDVAEAIRVAAVLLLPIMPRSAAEILRRVGETRAPVELRLDRDGPWRNAGERTIVKGAALWPRAEDAGSASRDPAYVPGEPARRADLAQQTRQQEPARRAGLAQQTRRQEPARRAGLAQQTRQQEPARRAGLAQQTRQQETTVEETPAPALPATAPIEDQRISIDDFMKTELRVARVLEAEAVPKSKKLIKLKVDVGEPAPRQVLAGIAEAYRPEQLVGRTIVIVVNLKPAKLMGLESNGMVLAASPDGGPPTLLAVDDSIPAGTRVR